MFNQYVLKKLHDDPKCTEDMRKVYSLSSITTAERITNLLRSLKTPITFILGSYHGYYNTGVIALKEFKTDVFKNYNDAIISGMIGIRLKQNPW